MTKDEILRRVLPQFFPAHWLEDAEIAFTPFPSSIRIGYVIRADGRYSYVTKEELSVHSLDVKELHEAALANLGCFGAPEVKIGRIPNGAEGWVVSSDDNFAAVRILLPEGTSNTPGRD